MNFENFATKAHLATVPADRSFCDSFGLRLNIPQVVAEIGRFIRMEPGFKYVVGVGTDSERIAGGNADFVTAIVIRRVGNGGRYFWKRKNCGPFHTLRDRIIQEALFSIETAGEVLSELKKVSDVDFNFEVHADIGMGGDTREMMNEVVGMIRAYNYEVKVKPESYAATNVADRHV